MANTAQVLKDNLDLSPLHCSEVSPERVGVAGVLWSTLRRGVCVQLRKIHFHSPVFRLREPRDAKEQHSLAKQVMVKQRKEAKHTVACTLRNTTTAALFSLSLLLKSPSSPLLLRSVPESQPVVNHKLNVTELVDLPHYELLRYSSPATSNEEENKGEEKERKGKTQPPVAASLLRHEAKHRQALMRAADIPVCRGTHNNASVRGRELADLFLHVGSSSRRDGGHGRKRMARLFSSLPVLAGENKKPTGNGWQRQTVSGCSEQTPR